MLNFHGSEFTGNKKVIDLLNSPEVVKQITSITIEPGVEIQVAIADLQSQRHALSSLLWVQDL